MACEKGQGSFRGKHHSEITKRKISEAKKRFYSTHPNPFLGHHHTLETKEQIREKALGRPSSNKDKPMKEETKIKLSNALNGRHLSEETRAKMRGRQPWNKGKPHSAETKKKIANLAVERMQNPEARRKISEGHKGISVSAETKSKISAAIKRLWKDNPQFALKVIEGRKEQWQRPGYRERTVKAVIKALKKRPNKPEKHLIKILSVEALPFRYTGDGSFILGGYIPDFVQFNGEKQIIEVFGDYWHNKKGIAWHETELGRIMAYKQFGYETLVIWEHELKDEDRVIEKIKVFVGSTDG